MGSLWRIIPGWMDDVSRAQCCLPACQCLAQAEDMSRLWEGMQAPACGSLLGEPGGCMGLKEKKKNKKVEDTNKFMQY